MTTQGYALTIAGVPYIFTTSNMGTLTSSSSLWWGGEAGTSYADGWLAWPRGSITERARPLEGELDVTPLSFELHDAATSAGGSPLLTGIAGRDSVGLTSSPVASSVTAAATSITVGDGGLFSAPCFAWIEGECVRVTAVASNTLTVTRGRLGTKAAVHTVDATIGRFPEAFTTVPWTTRRKVHLWRVDGTTATLLWSGYAVRAPMLADDGARYTMQCDPLWSVQASNPVGGVLGSTRFAGYTNGRISEDAAGFSWLASYTTLAGGTDPASGTRTNARTRSSYRTLDALLRHHQTQAASLTNTDGQRVVYHFARTGDSFTVDADSTLAFNSTLKWLDDTEVNLQSRVRGSLRSVSGTIQKAPASMVFISTTGGGGTYLVSSLLSLPSSWSAVATTDAGYTTTEEPVLRLHVSDDWTMLFTSVSTADSGEHGPRIASQTVWIARKPGARLPENGRYLLPNSPVLKAAYRVRAEHWMLGLKHSLMGLCEDVNTYDWDWTSVYSGSASGTALRATAGLRVARDWVFDGRRTLGSVVTECCLLHGCSPVVRSGRLALHAWGWPSARETPAATLTAADIIGNPSWSRWSDGLANRLLIKSEALNVDATLQQSRARYGPGRQITVDLAGIEDQLLPVDDPYAFAREVVGRLELWSEPLGVVTLTVKASQWSTLELGTVLRVTEWMLPSGSGGRGLSAKLGVVIGRTLDLERAQMKVEAILFPRVSYPYAPCAKASSVVSSTELALASNYVGGASTYSGTTDAGTFEAGDVIELIERDTTTAWVEQLTIASVDTGTNRLTFTSAMSATAQTKIGAGWVDVRFADYAVAQASQQSEWMFVADDTSGVIDGTAEPQRVIAP